MKFLSFTADGKESYGAVVGQGKDAGVFDLGKRYGKKYPTLRAAIVDGALKTLAKAAQGKKPDHKLSRIKYLPVLPDARKIICVGLNYHEHRDHDNRPFRQVDETAIGRLVGLVVHRRRHVFVVVIVSHSVL